MSRKLSRRDFLILAGATSAGLALSACGVKPTVIPTLTNTLSPTSTLNPSSTPTITESPTATVTPGFPPLRQLADKIGFDIGTAVPGPFWLDNPPAGYYDIIRNEFNLGIVHIGLYWNDYEPQDGQEAIGMRDYVKRQIKKLKELGINTLRAHALIYPPYIPEWIVEKYEKKELAKDNLLSYMRRHVESVINLVKSSSGSMKREWTVVNEPYKDPYFHGNLQSDIPLKVLGKEYIDIVFDWTNELDPESTLIFQDTLNHGTDAWNGYNTEQTRSVVDRLRNKSYSQKIRVGVEGHIDADRRPNKQDMIDTLQGYSLPVIISEVDVNLKNIYMTPEDRYALQADIYGDILDAGLQSGVCNSFSIWEFGDKYSWLEPPNPGGHPDADPTPFDDNLEPKPAYYALYNILSQYAAHKSSGTTATSTP